MKSYRWTGSRLCVRIPQWPQARAHGLTWYTSRSPHHVRSTWWQARSLSVYHLRSVDTVKFHTKRLPLNSRSSTPHMNTEAIAAAFPPSLGSPILGSPRCCS